MDHKRILAAAAALCLSFGAVQADIAFSPSFAAVYAADEAEDNVITLPNVGDSIPVEVSGATTAPQWYSDDDSVATITGDPDNKSKATVTATGVGTTNVYAVVGGQLLKYKVVVENEAVSTPDRVSIGSFKLDNQLDGATLQVTGADSRDIKWSTSDPTVAVVDDEGNIRAVGKGKCTITGEYNGITYYAEITSEYDKAIPFIPENLAGTIKLSDAEPAKKVNVNAGEGAVVEWSSTNEKVATVSDGLINATGKGKCRIYAQVDGVRYYFEIESEFTGESAGKLLGTIELTDASPSRQPSLNNVPEGVTPVWSSSDESVATVDEYGKITAKASGSCNILVRVGDSRYYFAVTSKVSGEAAMPELIIRGIGNTSQLSTTGMDGKVTFTSSDKKVATVDANGLVTAVGEGTAVITADNGKTKASVKITVTPAGLVGDANLDKKVTVADAVAILQSIANRDKYALKPQGSVNADVDGVSGVTANDALVIQKFDSGVVTKLPLEKKQ